MEIPIIKEIVVIFTLSIFVLLICHKLGLPTVVGFLLTGVLCGPHSLGLVKAVDDVEQLSTIGIVLLLFTVGMEFSIKNIIKYKHFFFIGGGLQILLTILTSMAIGKFAMGGSWGQAVFLGFLICLSSTAIVLRVLDEKGDAESPHGRLILGILIFQDIVAVPMMLLTPILAGAGEEIDAAHVYNFLIGMVFLVVMAVVAFRAVPKLLDYVTRTRSRELFLLSVLTVCFSVAWITSSVGLSLSLGAFFAGLVISESEYSDEAVSDVLPFQEIFTSFFFVSMGMLLDVSFVIQQPFIILGATLVIILLKSFVTGGVAILLGMPLRSAILAAVAISQIGEFSFILAHIGMNYELVTDYQYQLFLAVALLTMTLTPTRMSWSHKISHWITKLPLPSKLVAGHNTQPHPEKKQLENHIIIVGFGLRGQHLAKAAKEAGLPYVILDMNPEVVHKGRQNGEPIQYGDPSHHGILKHVGIKNARVLAVVIYDVGASKRIVKRAKELNPNVYVITRTRYFSEVTKMFQVGADDVIPDEFGSSIEIFTRVLQKSNVPIKMINTCANEIRQEGYNALRWEHKAAADAPITLLDPLEARIETVDLLNGSPLIGKTIVESELKKLHGLTILLIKRHNLTLTNIEADMKLEVADSLVVVGTPYNLEKAKPLFCAI